MSSSVVLRRSKSGTTRSCESEEVNVSDYEYEVEHKNRNRPVILRGGGGKSENFRLDLIESKRNMIGISFCAIVAFVWTTVSTNGFKITYECGPSPGNVTIHLAGNNTYKVAVGGLGTYSTHQNCSRKLLDISLPNDITLSNCSYPGKWTLYLMKPRGNLEKATGVDTFLTYSISCQASSTTISGSLIVDSTMAPTAVKPTIELKMNITPNQIHLGQEVHVIITEENTAKQELNISSCKAKSKDGNETIELVAADGSYQADLVKSVSPGTGYVEMILYGFRFTKDSYVNITCTVKICGIGSSCKDAAVAVRDVQTRQFTVEHLQTVSGSFRAVA